ncbi:MAG: pyridoxal phosphate-dependent aminotransferase [Ignavibacteriae bacterium]|nr:pyridoxal phosphate-dependent aminotransferase [Ignavibacteria bacterium]MBI3365360.1 pyridoxal phosphate-dependent aminotransferase [Ignavibacteriota bacterium]
MSFSSRTSWPRQRNRLAKLLEERQRQGKPIFDLTISNPTECSLAYPQKEILSALSDPAVLRYSPDPRGLLSAREAVVKYYQTKNVELDSSNIFLTASTSEAYSYIFKLLCNSGEHVLVPRPSYPLFEYLAQINDVALQHYRLSYDHGWHIDKNSIREGITESTRAIMLIHPHNPTGMFLKKSEYAEAKAIARDHNLALIVDEVFSEYGFSEDAGRIVTTAASPDVLTFTLSGISKMAGLPQMKLGWMIVSGEQRLLREANERLDILCDTFLSVNTPVQFALPKFLRTGKGISENILARIRKNWRVLQLAVRNVPSCSLLDCEGGWYGIVRLPRVNTDEEWALQFLEEAGVYVYPGYFFDLEEGMLVVSLLVEEEIFRRGVSRLVEHVSRVL